MHAVTTAGLAEIERAVSARMIEVFGVDTSALALDMTNFATYLDSTNPRAPVAQRGKAKQKRADLRLVGLGLIVTRDGGIPLLSHTYPGNKPDVTQFTAMIDELRARHTRLGGDPAGSPWCSTPGRTRWPTSPTWPPPSCVTSARYRPPTARTCSPCPHTIADWSTSTGSTS
jgi:hypothetical protein